MQITITEFKAKCTEYVRTVSKTGGSIEITNRGRVVAVVSAPSQKSKKNLIFGSLKNTVIHITEDFDDPLGDDEWEAAKS
ncbi:MAG: type II toxin-antitoxin system prevent-host-death family antitoxin [Desulfobacter postgatei]|uniref:Type II toxin-antitoxin system prevent-host-death family antitoxin n=1 Tax=Desulfobacter postgatei TaxID=2293 RepID=A0A2G6MTI2_9BACT|nr:MAG: type II toxin-antitoxin system prevent-host-death family antitoxin [Desulfobacter postgatei]